MFDALKNIQVCDILLLTQSDLGYVCATTFFSSIWVYSNVKFHIKVD